VVRAVCGGFNNRHQILPWNRKYNAEDPVSAEMSFWGKIILHNLFMKMPSSLLAYFLYFKENIRFS
jgi:hypothetical protein